MSSVMRIKKRVDGPPRARRRLVILKKKAIVRQSQRCFNPLTDGWQNKNNSRYFYVDISRQPQIIQDNYQPMPLTGCWNFKKELKYVIWKHIFGQNDSFPD